MAPSIGHVKVKSIVIAKNDDAEGTIQLQTDSVEVTCKSSRRCRVIFSPMVLSNTLTYLAEKIVVKLIQI